MFWNNYCCIILHYTLALQHQDPLHYLCQSSFISTQFFVLNLDGWFGVCLLLFDIPLLYYHINLRSLIIYSLFSGNIDLSFGIPQWNPIISVSFSTVSELFCRELLGTFVILSAFLLRVKSPFASPSEAFGCIYNFSFYVYFYQCFFSCF